MTSAPTVYAFEGVVPVIDPAAYVHPSAVLIGDVIVGPGCYVGAGAVLRGDFGRIVLERNSNVQDNCVVHSRPDLDCVMEEESHIGHGAVIHCARVARDAMVGIGAVVMDQAVVASRRSWRRCRSSRSAWRSRRACWWPACPPRCCDR